MSGDGALEITAAPQLVWTFEDTASVERDWIMSYWTYVDNFRAAVSVPRLMETDPQGNVSQNEGVHREKIPWAEAYGQWLEVNLPVKTKGRGFKYQLFMDNSGPIIDNFLFRPASDTCVIVLDDMILYNNLPLPKR
jgi:hypothetical protein